MFTSSKGRLNFSFCFFFLPLFLIWQHVLQQAQNLKCVRSSSRSLPHREWLSQRNSDLLQTSRIHMTKNNNNNITTTLKIGKNKLNVLSLSRVLSHLNFRSKPRNGFWNPSLKGPQGRFPACEILFLLTIRGIFLNLQYRTSGWTCYITKSGSKIEYAYRSGTKY